MSKIKSILAVLVFLSVPVFWSFTSQAAGNFGVESITVLDKSINVVADTPTVSGNTITSTIIFHKLNDYVKYNLRIKNSTPTSYEILDITDDNSSALIEYSYDNHANEVISAGESLDLELTVAYVQEHLDDSDRNINNNVKLKISYLDLHTGVVEEDEIILVPDTGANTVWGGFSKNTPCIMVFMIVLTGVGLLAAVLYKKKRTVFVLAFGLVFTITGLTYMNATAEDYIEREISFNSEIKLRDYFYGEVYCKDPDTGEDLHMDTEEFGGAIYYDDEEFWKFGEIFDKEWWPAPSGLTVTRFIFTGTDIDVDPEALILDDFNVTILYGVPTYNITYDYDGGTVAVANPTTIKGDDEPFTLNVPTKDGVLFGCWTGSNISQGYCESEITINPSEVTEDLYFKAVYEYVAIIQDQNGNELERGSVIDGISVGSGFYYSIVFQNVSGYRVNSGSCTNGQRLRLMGSSVPYSSYEVDSISASTVCTLNIVPAPMDVRLTVIGGSGSGMLSVNRGENAVFENVTVNSGYYPATSVECDNDQTATISGTTVTVNNVTKNTNCYVRNTQMTFYNITNMQEMTTSICESATIPNVNATQFDTTGARQGNANYIPRRELIDVRDGNTYQVTKLADGKCWMTENLALGSKTEPTVLTPDTSDVISEYTIPVSDISAFPADKTIIAEAFYLDDRFGGYYSTKVANVGGDNKIGGTSSNDASICPKGWHLGSYYDTWDKLIKKYNITTEGGQFQTSVSRLYGEPFNLVNSGYINNGQLNATTGFRFAMLTSWVKGNSHNSQPFVVSDDYIGSGYLDVGYGGSVRCFAR